MAHGKTKKRSGRRPRRPPHDEDDQRATPGGRPQRWPGRRRRTRQSAHAGPAEGHRQGRGGGQVGKERALAMIVQEEDLFLMSNLSPKMTGLSFVVWISPRGNAKHDVRVKVSRGPKTKPDEWVTVGIRPDVQVLYGTLPAEDLRTLRLWVAINRAVLVRFWDGDIEYTEDVLRLLRPLEE